MRIIRLTYSDDSQSVPSRVLVMIDTLLVFFGDVTALTITLYLLFGLSVTADAAFSIYQVLYLHGLALLVGERVVKAHLHSV